MYFLFSVLTDESTNVTSVLTNTPTPLVTLTESTSEVTERVHSYISTSETKRPTPHITSATSSHVTSYFKGPTSIPYSVASSSPTSQSVSSSSSGTSKSVTTSVSKANTRLSGTTIEYHTTDNSRLTSDQKGNMHCQCSCSWIRFPDFQYVQRVHVLLL